jgi:hypothetical protein
MSWRKGRKTKTTSTPKNDRQPLQKPQERKKEMKRREKKKKKKYWLLLLIESKITRLSVLIIVPGKLIVVFVDWSSCLKRWAVW